MKEEVALGDDVAEVGTGAFALGDGEPALGEGKEVGVGDDCEMAVPWGHRRQTAIPAPASTTRSKMTHIILRFHGFPLRDREEETATEGIAFPPAIAPPHFPQKRSLSINGPPQCSQNLAITEPDQSIGPPSAVSILEGAARGTHCAPGTSSLRMLSPSFPLLRCESGWRAFPQALVRSEGASHRPWTTEENLSWQDQVEHRCAINPLIVGRNGAKPWSVHT